MRVITGLERLDTEPLGRSTSVVIGNFDGCHLGHQQLLKKAGELAKSHSSLSVGMTFLPHPEVIFGDLDASDLLFPIEQKIQAFQEFGFDAIVIQPFDTDLAATPHEAFYERDLKKRLNAKAIVVGENFRFGSNRSGDGSYLKDAGARDGIHVHLGEHIVDNQDVISSTRIRACLRLGDVETAAKALGRPYALYGKIVRGDQQGRTIGFPTLNLQPADQLIPAHGVYAGWLQVGPETASTPIIHPPLGSLTPAVFNIGVRPTVGGKELRIEGHGLARNLGEAYGQDAYFFLAHRLRGEKKFSSLDSLQKQIQLDTELARSLLVS